MNKLLIIFTMLLTSCAIYPTHRSIAIKYCEQKSYDTTCEGYDRESYKEYNNIEYIQDQYETYRRPW